MFPPFPPKIDLANTPTPFRLLSNLTRELNGPRIWLKSDDHTGSVLSGNKVRKLEFLLSEAMDIQAGVVITCGGIQSNHCRATAMACAQLGLKCHLILRTGDNTDDDRVVDGNWFLDALCNAEITLVDKKEYAKSLEWIFANMAKSYLEKGIIPYCIPTGGSNETGLWGYLSTAMELSTDFKTHGISPQTIVCASGSGGTQGGLTLGMHLLESKTQVYGFAVCDDAAYFKRKIIKDVKGWRERYYIDDDFDQSQLNIHTIDTYIGPGYSKGYGEVYGCIKKVAQLEGVVLDPVYTGKAFHGMLCEIKNGIFKNHTDIVFVHTGGIFGLFPQRHQFDFGYQI